jgi:hypothetical protein
MSYIVEIEPKLSPLAWQPQYQGDTPRWHSNVFAVSPVAALKAMERVYPAGQSGSFPASDLGLPHWSKQMPGL